ncbi:MAG TPA: bifunctional metallophosphatase/5'-nucleotidase [Caldithrix abyssi]|uniref:Bifunctional metallophosphatase/5'-nucleotidase n=1 Tax=Caldithrix abyssi TaxID=187145 RepID=A0A7V4WWU7_CALAY|nr:bifunctional metallophosphatase/5'-nucleotidase [Caldithrix abyssi]
MPFIKTTAQWKKGIRNLLVLLVGLSFLPLRAQVTDTLFILQTTDVHGNIMPYNYFKDAPADYGLAKIYNRVIEYRKRHKNVLLLDSGDLLQGTPLVSYFNTMETNLPNPLILTLNYMGYEAFTVGNHDIEQGLFVYNRARRESDFPWLSANSLLEDGRTYFKPYTIINKNGLRIGIIGLTTPGIPMWLDKSLYPGITWADMVKTAQKYVPLLRPQVDVLVGLFHAGFEAGYSAAQTEKAGLPNENASLLVAENIPGFDVVLAGHSHRPRPKNAKEQIKDQQKPLLINAGSWGRNLGVAQIILRKDADGGKWRVVEKSGWLEPSKNVQPSTAILELNAYYHKKTLQYIRQPIAKLNGTMSTEKARFEDTAVMELINDAQMQAAGADISFAACFNDRVRFKQGTLRVKDVYAIYPYENYLYLVEMTGKQIRDFLIYSARYFILDHGKVVRNPAVNGYNYDMAEGIGYTIKVEATTEHPQIPNKIIDLIYLKTGKPLDLNKTYKVAMNSYRASGGGGHMAFAGAQEAPVLWKSNADMRTILIDYLKNKQVIEPKSDGNWRLEY